MSTLARVEGRGAGGGQTSLPPQARSILKSISDTTDAPDLEAYLELEMLSGRRLLGVIGNLILTGEPDHSEAGFKGAKTLTNASTDYPVSSTSVPCRGVLIAPHPSNTGRVWIAIGVVAAAGQGVWLDPTSPPIPLPVLDLNMVHALAETAGDKVTWIGRV